MPKLPRPPSARPPRLPLAPRPATGFVSPVTTAADPLAEARVQHQRLGPAAALPAYVAATRARPRDPAVWDALAACCFAIGRLDEAETALVRAIGLDATEGAKPGSGGRSRRTATDDGKGGTGGGPGAAIRHRQAERLGNLAMLRSRRGGLVPALEAATEAVALAPDHPPLRLRRVRVLLDLGRVAEAEADVRWVLAQTPDDGEGWALLAALLILDERAEAAGPALDAAQRLTPDRPDLWVLTAERAASLGDLAAARAALDRALALDPTNPRAHHALSGLVTYRAEAPEWQALAPLVAPQALARCAPAEAVLLHFAAAKALDDLGRPDEAFAHLVAGNDLRRASLPDDLPALTARARAIASWTAGDVAPPARTAAAAGLAAPPPGMPRPVFIVGMPRSGTTLVEQILAAHPAVHGAGETGLLAQVIADLGLAEDTGPPGDLTPERLEALAAAYRAGLRDLAPGAAVVINKTPGNWLHLGLIHRAMPEALVLACVRDPVACCWSCYRNLFGRGHAFTTDLARLGRVHRLYDRTLETWTRILDPRRMTRVGYETLVAAPEAETRRLVAFLDLPWEEVCLAPAAVQRAVGSLSKAQVRQPIHRNALGRARAYAAHLGPLHQALAEEPW